MKKKLTAVLAVLLCFVLICGVPARAVSDAQDDLNKLIDLGALIYLYSLDNTSDDPLYDALVDLLTLHPELYDELAKLMTDRLDPYTNLFTEEEFNKYYPEGVGYVGVGVTIDGERDTGWSVQSVVTGGPADTAGLKPGDEIVALDGRDVTSFPPQAASSLLRGEEGSQVALTVKRSGADEPFSLTITRAALTATNVSYRDMGGGVGCIRIAGFGSLNDFLAFVDTYESLPDRGVSSVIIDLRGNPGGDMDVMYNILNNIVARKGVVLYAMQYAFQSLPELFLSDGIAEWTPKKLVVLVDEHTASAAEVFAGSLQCNGLADTVGVQTYGKGRGQMVVWLGQNQDSAAVITAAEMILPDNTKYDKKGITPKYTVPLTEAPYPETELHPLPLTQAILPTARSARVTALEERLALVGAFLGKPDERWTDYTTYALNLFQQAHGLKETKYADVDTLKALDTEAAAVLASTVVVDSQLDKALEIIHNA